MERFLVDPMEEVARGVEIGEEVRVPLKTTVSRPIAEKEKQKISGFGHTWVWTHKCKGQWKKKLMERKENIGLQIPGSKSWTHK